MLAIPGDAREQEHRWGKPGRRPFPESMWKRPNPAYWDDYRGPKAQGDEIVNDESESDFSSWGLVEDRPPSTRFYLEYIHVEPLAYYVDDYHTIETEDAIEAAKKADFSSWGQHFSHPPSRF